MQLVNIDPTTKLANAVRPMPTGWCVTTDDGPLNQDGLRLYMQDNGNIARTWDLRGFGCFTGEDGRTPGTVPDDPAMVGKSWDDLAKLTPPLLQVAKPKTQAELDAEAAAAAQATAEALKAKSVPLIQFRGELRKEGLYDGLVTAANAANDPDVVDSLTMLDPVPYSSKLMALLASTNKWDDTRLQTFVTAALAYAV